MTVTIGRRELLVVLGGAAAWPLAARAQQREKMRRIGVLMNLSPDDAEGQAPSRGVPAGVAGSGLGCRPQCPDRAPLGRGRHRALSQPCRGIGASRTGVILAAGGIAAQALQRVSRTIPIVFANAADPVGMGVVASLARPGGNVTGLSVQSNELAGKRIELLREVVPGLRRLAILGNVGNPFTVLELAGMLASLIDGRCSWPTVIPAFVASKRSTSLAIKPSALRRGLRRGAETRPSLDELYYDSMQAQREARLRLDAPTPRVRIFAGYPYDPFASDAPRS